MARKGTSIGLDISAGSIKVAEIGITRGEPVLNKLAVALLPEGLVLDGEIEDPEAIAIQLRELWKQYRIRHKKVVLGIANQKLIVRPLNLPYMPEDELETAVQYQVQESIPIPTEDAIIDYEVIEEYMSGEEQRMQTVLLAAAHRDMINIFFDALRAGGLMPTAIEVKALAMIRSLVKREYEFLKEKPEEPESVCILNIGGGISNIAIVRRDAPLFVRTLMRGGDHFTYILTDRLGLTPVEAEDIIRGLSTDDEANKLLDREVGAFVGEVRRSLEYYLSQVEERDLNKIILSGSGSRVINLPTELNKGLRLPVEIGHPLQNVRLGRLPYTPEELADMESSIAICTGLSLRELEE